MDLQLTPAAAFDGADSPGGMPPEAPLGMPAQDLGYLPWRHEPAPDFRRGPVRALHPDSGHRRRDHLWGLSNAAIVRFASMTFLAGHD